MITAIKVKKFRGKRQYVVTYCLFPQICSNKKINLQEKQRMFEFYGIMHDLP